MEGQRMIVVSLNPCVDRTVWIDRFRYGGTNRTERVQEDVAGKGVNVSMALHALGQPCLCMGFDYRDSRRTVTQTLREQGIASELTVIPGALRTNLKIFEESTGVMSEINESGRTVEAGALDEFFAAFKGVLETLGSNAVVVLSGSIPPGVPADVYGSLTRMAKEAGARTILDASGKPLLMGIQEAPYAVKPNQDELRQLTGRKVETLEEAAEAGRELLSHGIHVCCASLGSLGAVSVTREHTYFAPALPVTVRGIQGAGDALVAGMCMALAQGRSQEETLRYGMAAAGGSVMRDGTQMCTRALFEALLPQVQVTELCGNPSIVSE